MSGQNLQIQTTTDQIANSLQVFVQDDMAEKYKCRYCSIRMQNLQDMQNHMKEVKKTFDDLFLIFILVIQ